MTKRGALVVIEGTDRSGKSSQILKLREYLEKTRQVEIMKFPNRETATGKIIDQYLKGQDNNDQAIHLLFAANRWESMAKIKKLLEDGVWCLVDRYAYSGVAYSAAKGLDFEWCKNCDRGILKPDIVLYFDITPERAALRGNYGSERYERIDFQLSVRNKFSDLMDKSWAIINADQDEEEVFKEVKQVVDDVHFKELKGLFVE